MKRFWKWLKRTFGMDKEFITGQDAMVARAEMTFLDKVQGQPITTDNLMVIDMLANGSFNQRVRARAQLIIRTDTSIDFMKEAQEAMALEDSGRKQRILETLADGDAALVELLDRLRLNRVTKEVEDHCLSLCMELESEGKVVEEAERWKIVTATALGN
jgi:uncharacterized protein (DUF2236 family)